MERFNFGKIRPILWTLDLKESIEYYKNILGFKIEEYNENLQWVSISKNDAELMIATANEHINLKKINFTGSFYINTNNIDDLWENLKEKAKICYEIETFEWQMREFAIYDNNGYILQFGEEVK